MKRRTGLVFVLIMAIIISVFSLIQMNFGIKDKSFIPAKGGIILFCDPNDPDGSNEPFIPPDIQ